MTATAAGGRGTCTGGAESASQPRDLAGVMRSGRASHWMTKQSRPPKHLGASFLRVLVLPLPRCSCHRSTRSAFQAWNCQLQDCERRFCFSMRRRSPPLPLPCRSAHDHHSSACSRTCRGNKLETKCDSWDGAFYGFLSILRSACKACGLGNRERGSQTRVESARLPSPRLRTTPPSPAPHSIPQRLARASRS